MIDIFLGLLGLISAVALILGIGVGMTSLIIWAVTYKRPDKERDHTEGILD